MPVSYYFISKDAHRAQIKRGRYPADAKPTNLSTVEKEVIEFLGDTDYKISDETYHPYFDAITSHAIYALMARGGGHIEYYHWATHIRPYLQASLDKRRKAGETEAIKDLTVFMDLMQEFLLRRYVFHAYR